MNTLKHFCISNDWFSQDLPPKYQIKRGWGNGYVVLPKEHPFHGNSYGDIEMDLTAEDNTDELTYGQLAGTAEKRPKTWADAFKEHDIKPDDYIIGFDTLHSWNNLKNSSEQQVRSRTEKLAIILTKFMPK